MLTASGDLGVLLIGYKRAAMLGAWQLTYGSETLGPPTTTLSAKVTSVDDYWHTQRPMSLLLRISVVPEKWWRWQVATVGHIVSGKEVDIEADGPPEVTDGIS